MLLFLCCDFSFEIIKFTLPYLTLPYSEVQAILTTSTSPVTLVTVSRLTSSSSTLFESEQLIFGDIAFCEEHDAM